VPADSRLENSLRSAEDELNLIKNQIQQTLLDIRERILDATNPFTVPAFPGMEEATEDSLAPAAGAAGTGDSDTASEEDQAEEVPGDAAVEEEEEEIELPGAEEEIVETELGAPDDGEELLIDSIDDRGPDGLRLEEETEEEPAEVDPIADEPEEGAYEEESETAGAIQSRESEPQPLDLISMASLVRWIAATLDRVGKDRLEVLLDAYELSGRMSPQVKSVARALCELADEDPRTGIPVRDIVRAMMRLDGVLGNDDGQSSRLLSLIFEDEFESADSLVASLGLG